MARSKTKDSWQTIRQYALDAGARYADLVAAQWALESGFGQHTSGANNVFGLKGKGTRRTTTEYVNGKPVQIEDGFLDFASVKECVQYLVTRWYRDWDRYEGVDRAPTREAAANALVQGGYATDPLYAEKLISLMNEHAPLSGVAPVDPKPILLRMVAVQDTWLKKRPVQAGELLDDQKVHIPVGRELGVCSYGEIAADAHVRVELASGAGAWFVYEPHWKRLGTEGQVVEAQIDWSDFACLVTKNLAVGEILQYDKRRIPGPNARIRSQLVRTAQEFQKVRDAWGHPLGVTSFYRPEPINAEVGGVPGSKHVSGEAFDIYPIDRSLESFYQWIRVRWTGGLGDGRARGFIHLDTAGGGFVPGAGVRPSREWNY